MAQQETNLDAADILNWDYLVQFGEQQEHIQTGWQALKQFAYDFTSNGNVAEQNIMLTELLKHVTFGHSDGSNEEVIAYIATMLKSDLEGLRKFAKERGIRLKRG